MDKQRFLDAISKIISEMYQVEVTIESERDVSE